MHVDISECSASSYVFQANDAQVFGGRPIDFPRRPFHFAKCNRCSHTTHRSYSNYSRAFLCNGLCILHAQGSRKPVAQIIPRRNPNDAPPDIRDIRRMQFVGRFVRPPTIIALSTPNHLDEDDRCEQQKTATKVAIIAEHNTSSTIYTMP